MRRAYSYLRFSTPEQAEGDSLRRQSELAEAYAQKHRLELDRKLTYQDLGVSAYKGKNVREGGQLYAFLEAVRRGLVEQGSYLLVESLDRLSRQQVGHALRLLQDICSEGVTVVTLADGKEYTAENIYTDIVSIIMSLLVFARAHEESATKAQRLRSVWAEKRRNAKDQPLTARTPAWIKLNRKAGTFELIPERAKVVREIFRLTLQGIGQNRVTEILNQKKVPTFGRARYWQRSYVLKILTSSATVGDFTPHLLGYDEDNDRKKRTPLETVRDYYPAVIDRKTFNRVQTMRSKLAPLRGRAATSGIMRNMFSSLAKCPKCGSTMTRVYKGSNGGTVKLVCAKAKAGAFKDQSHYRTVSYDLVEAAFLRDLEWLTNTVPAGGMEGETITQALQRAESALDTVVEQLVQVTRQKRTARRAQELREWEAARDRLEEECDKLRTQQEELAGPVIENKLAELRQVANTQPLDRRHVNGLLRQLVTGITVDYESGQLVFQWKHGGQSEVVYSMPKKEQRRSPTTIRGKK